MPSSYAATWQTLAAIERSFRRSPIARRCLIWGMRDWCFRPDCLERFIEAWPQAEVHRLADVGHWVVEDAPDESLAIVRATFWRRADEASRRRSDPVAIVSSRP